MRAAATNKPMVWVRIDDKLHSHPKILAAWEKEPASLGLHLLALSYAGAHLTDGKIDRQTVRQWTTTTTRRRQLVNVLVKSGLWTPVDGGWEIHDYLDYNESRERVLARRHAREVRKVRDKRSLNADL
jgi:hypothetical protein